REPHDGHVVPRHRHRQHHRGSRGWAVRRSQGTGDAAHFSGDDADRRWHRGNHPAHIARPAQLDWRRQMNWFNYRRRTAFASTLATACLLASCGGPKATTPPPKVDAVAFVKQVNTDLVELAKEGNAAGWT